ncbi:hypothetical protein [Winogradskyella sp. 3972H.M.0a.05]|uniref:hypothetical protein n=1 Tax=Winogradskyella sp. 3972H.M.0a.05 TaxID=2950277 RepID=UPI0033983353
MNKIKRYGVLLIALFCIQFTYSQWTKEKGKGYYKLSAWYLNTDQHYTGSGDIDPNATRSYFNLNFYGEYGISKKWNAIAYIPFFSRTTQNDILSGTTGQVLREGEAINSIGDIELGITYGILNKNSWALSSTLKLGIPTGNDSGGSDGSFQTGDGEFNQLIQLNLGKSFSISNLPVYSKLYLGFNNRTNNFSDEIKTGLEIGAQPWRDKLWLVAKFDVNQSLNNGSIDATNAQGNIFANNIEYVNLGGEIAYYINQKIGISFNYTSAISGRIVAANPSFSAGLFLDVK